MQADAYTERGRIPLQMAGPMTNPLVAKQQILDAQESRRAVGQKRSEDAEENVRVYERFHNNLALLSGGTIALSVTYLGFLGTPSHSQPRHISWLVASWVLLFLCLVCATLYNLFHPHYVLYARTREYVKKLKDEKETLADNVPFINVVGITNKKDLDDYVQDLRQAASSLESDVTWASKRERIYGERLCSLFKSGACDVCARDCIVALVCCS